VDWRLARIPALEMYIYALGRSQFADLFPQDERTGRLGAVVRDSNEDPAIRSQLIEAKIFLDFHRQLSNLSIQENRLRRHREKDLAALREMQESRRRREKARLTEAARQYIQAVHEERHGVWEPEENGFEFSRVQVELRALELEPGLFAAWVRGNAAEQNAA
jgi:hypothetical protein